MSKRAEEAAKEIHYLALIEANRIAREQWNKGYKQAEKDLALTWEDIPKLIELTGKTYRYFVDNGQEDVSLEELYEEVLRRFNKLKAEEK